jgi:hypothetical protein
MISDDVEDPVSSWAETIVDDAGTFSASDSDVGEYSLALTVLWQQCLVDNVFNIPCVCDAFVAVFWTPDLNLKSV